MKVKLNVKSIYLAKEIMILDRFPAVMASLKDIVGNIETACALSHLRVLKGLDKGQAKKYVNAEDIERFLWEVVNPVWVGEYPGADENYNNIEIKLENEQEKQTFLKLPEYLDKLDKIDDLCRNIRKGWIDEEHYMPSSGENPYISIDYIQEELRNILE